MKITPAEQELHAARATQISRYIESSLTLGILKRENPWLSIVPNEKIAQAGEPSTI
jgi:hypothetical protein